MYQSVNWAGFLYIRLKYDITSPDTHHYCCYGGGGGHYTTMTIYNNTQLQYIVALLLLETFRFRKGSSSWKEKQDS